VSQYVDHIWRCEECDKLQPSWMTVYEIEVQEWNGQEWKQLTLRVCAECNPEVNDS